MPAPVVITTIDWRIPIKCTLGAHEVGEVQVLHVVCINASIIVIIVVVVIVIVVIVVVLLQLLLLSFAPPGVNRDGCYAGHARETNGVLPHRLRKDEEAVLQLRHYLNHLPGAGRQLLVL
jgi:hypothetical protein